MNAIQNTIDDISRWPNVA